MRGTDSIFRTFLDGSFRKKTPCITGPTPLAIGDIGGGDSRRVSLRTRVPPVKICNSIFELFWVVGRPGPQFSTSKLPSEITSCSEAFRPTWSSSIFEKSDNN